jgi:hypothetical protein
VLVERRFVIDFVAGRRMVVTDDIEAKLGHPDGTADYGPTFQGSVAGLPNVIWAQPHQAARALAPGDQRLDRGRR